jgi:hypothetical protein
VKLEPGNDARLFLGITEIWNHLDRAIDIVNASPYHDVLSRAYSDATLSSPIPETIDEDKTLIPLSIRLRVLQKFRNSKRKYSVYVPPILDDIEPHPTLPGAFIPAPVEPVHSGIVFVRPPGMDDDDW